MIRGDRIFVLRLAALTAATSFASVGCGEFGVASEEPAVALRRGFPVEADRVLQQKEMFVATNRGFSVDATNNDGPWYGPSVVLPNDARDAIRFRNLNGTEIRVREVHADGKAIVAERSLTYKRSGGTAFWTPHPQGVEEWLHLDESVVRAGETVASWEVVGSNGSREWQHR